MISAWMLWLVKALQVDSPGSGAVLVQGLLGLSEWLRVDVWLGKTLG